MGYQVLDGGQIGVLSDTCIIGLGAGNPTGGFVSMTAAQMQTLYQTKSTPIADADLAGDLTFYKTCAGNVIAKLTVPAAAQRLKGSLFLYGSNRQIRSEDANVVSLVDGNGNAVTSAKSISDASTTYTPGSQVTAKDVYGNSSSYSFSDSRSQVGIYGFLTLLEAATGYLSTASTAPNLTALGL